MIRLAALGCRHFPKCHHFCDAEMVALGVGTLEITAPEILQHEGLDTIAYLLPSLKGIQTREFKWEPKK
jgi:hypothetical protein